MISTPSRAGSTTWVRTGGSANPRHAGEGDTYGDVKDKFGIEWIVNISASQT